MYCAATAPIPLNEFGRDAYADLALSTMRQQRTFAAVEYAASRYACAGTIPPSAFPGFGLNFQNQVSRAAGLLNSAMATLGSVTQAQQAVSSSGTSGAPTVVPLNPVDVNPRPKTDVPAQGPFDTPQWGDYDAQWPGICTPGTALLNWLQQNPWLALGGLAAVLLAGGALGSGVKRRRRRAR